MGQAAEVVALSSSILTDGGCPVAQVNDLSRSLTAFDPISTLVVVVEMSKASWLVSGAVPGVERQPLKKLEPDATALLRLIERWRNEAVRAGRPTRAREPCQRALTHHQPHEECARPSRGPGIQATSAQGARASGRSADSGGHGPAGEHHRGVPARHGTAGTGP